MDTPNPVAPAVVKKTRNFNSKEEDSLEFIDDDDEPPIQKIVKSNKPGKITDNKDKITDNKDKITNNKDKITDSKEEIVIKKGINKVMESKAGVTKTVKSKKKVKAESDKEDDGNYVNKQEESKKLVVNIPKMVKKEDYQEPDLDFID